MSSETGVFKVLYDTGILIGYLRGQRKWKKPVEDARDGFIEVFISSITLLELHLGAHLSDDYETSYKDILTIQNWFHVVSVDEKVAKIGAAILADLRKRNQLIEVRDVLIAACAMKENLALKTTNLKHFKRIQGLVLDES